MGDSDWEHRKHTYSKLG